MSTTIVAQGAVPICYKKKNTITNAGSYLTICLKLCYNLPIGETCNLQLTVQLTLPGSRGNAYEGHSKVAVTQTFST